MRWKSRFQSIVDWNQYSYLGELLKSDEALLLAYLGVDFLLLEILL